MAPGPAPRGYRYRNLNGTLESVTGMAVKLVVGLVEPFNCNRMTLVMTTSWAVHPFWIPFCKPITTRYTFLLFLPYLNSNKGSTGACNPNLTLITSTECSCLSATNSCPPSSHSFVYRLRRRQMNTYDHCGLGQRAFFASLNTR